jgi:predicted ATPase/DNA-binding SARP family transcriptional activator
MNGLSLTCFGTVKATRDGEPLSDFRYDKVRALLVFLAVEAAQPHRRETLIGLLWPELPYEAARANLRQGLATLRTALGDRSATPPFLLISRESVQWNAAADTWVDVNVFTDLLQTCSRHSHRHPSHCHACARRYAQVAELYRGGFLAHFFLPDSAPFEEWAALKREALQRLALEALSYLAAYHERRGEYTEAEGYVRRQLEMEPWHEAAHRHLMRLLLLSDQRSHALAHYEQCRRILAEELGVEPDAETTALYEQMRDQDPELLVDVGRLALPSARAHNLPPPPTPFVGREQELAAIAALLDDPACRLLTLVGLGGVGKSRLALQAAIEQLDAFAHGVYFVPLATVASVALCVMAIGEAIGCPFAGDAEPKAQLFNFLRNKEMLLVLDNFEHLLEAADLLAEMLATAPEVSVLVTSRERLALQGEWLFEVQGLPYPPAQLVASAAWDDALCERYSAMHLFLKCAARLQPGFALDKVEYGCVARICRLVEGMPLAIELAAAWVRVLSCAEIAGQIEQGIEILASSLRDLSPRHRSVYAVFDYSWALLSPAEQAVLRKLSVFRSGCRRESGEQVAGASLPLLAALVDKSWLRRTPAGRYTLHELLRHYGWQKLEQAGEAAETQHRHLAYFLGLAEAAEPHLQEMQSTAWLKQLEVEEDNLRAALTWSLAGGDVEAGLGLAGASWLFWWLRGHIGEGRAWLEALLEKNEPAPPALRARAYRGAGGLAYYQSDLSHAQRYMEQALALYQEIGDRKWISQTLRNLAVVLSDQGQFEQARGYAEESLTLARQLGDAQTLANALSDLGILEYYLGNCARALPYMEEGLALDRRRGDQNDVAIGLHNLAEVRTAMGHFEAAIQLCAESMALFRQVENKYGLAFALQAQGDLLGTQGNIEEGKKQLAEGLALFQELGNPQGVAASLVGFAAVAVRQEEWERAARLLGAVEAQIEEGVASLKPPMQLRHQRTVAAVQAQMDEKLFEVAWASGRSMVLEQALAYALAE